MYGYKKELKNFGYKIKFVGYVIHKTFRQKREVTGETVIKTFSGSKCL